MSQLSIRGRGKCLPPPLPDVAPSLCVKRLLAAAWLWYVSPGTHWLSGFCFAFVRPMCWPRRPYTGVLPPPRSFQLLAIMVGYVSASDYCNVHLHFAGPV